jgi:hypothetical protein
MSNHVAIAAVTATLTNMIQRAVDADAAVSGGRVTARPPDRARQGGATGNQINLFLYRTSIDAAWRNHDPPSLRPGESGQPPLPLVLSYLVTAYGENDDDVLSHRLLGLAMSVLNDRPVLSRDEIQRLLDPAAGSELENQIERVRITPDPRPQDEISRMWATFGTGYRLSVSYDAAVVLIDSLRPVAAPAPVLNRGKGDAGPLAAAGLLPEIQRVAPPNGQAAARPGDIVTLTGRNLATVATVEVSGVRVAAERVLDPAAVSAGALTVQLPAAQALPAGMVALAVRPAGAGPAAPVSSASPLALAPTIDSAAPLKAKLDAKGAASLKVKCKPPVQPGQTIALLVNDQVVPAPPVAKASSQLTFALAGFKPGTYTLRLRIDGVDSIPVAEPVLRANAQAASPMDIDPNQQVVLTA